MHIVAGRCMTSRQRARKSLRATREGVRGDFIVCANSGGDDGLGGPFVPSTIACSLSYWLKSRILSLRKRSAQQFWSDADRETYVDVFVTEPFGLDEEPGRQWILQSAQCRGCAAAKIEPLIAMGRTRHHVSWKQRFAAAPKSPPDSATPLQRMRIG
jgi:hypothetical protein